MTGSGAAGVEPPTGGGLPLETAVVWALFAVVTLEILVTYSRLPARELYHVSGSGIEGGASRAFVFTNFPVALVAIAILLLLADRLSRRGIRILAAVGVAASAAVFWPGVVNEADLDARPVNAIAAAGVTIALALTVVAAQRLGRPRRPRPEPGDRVRIAIAAIVLALALPWIAADLGFFLNGVPLLGRLFQTGAYLKPLPNAPPFPPAVHHGHHHGMDGTLLVLSALLLSRPLPGVRLQWLRLTLGAYLALMFCYGVGNIANDFWTEQVWKRHWTTWQIPNVLEPRASVSWGLIVLGTIVVWSVWVVRTQPPVRAQ